MTVEMNLDEIPLNLPNICISYADLSVDNKQILTVFNKLNWGKINSIEFTICSNSSKEKFYKIFIYFDKWFNKYNEYRIKLLNNEKQYIIYQFPWFWKITKYRYNHLKQNSHSENNIQIKNKERSMTNLNWRNRQPIKSDSINWRNR